MNANIKTKLYQANRLTESRYNFTAVEKRVVYTIMQQIRRNFVDSNNGDKTLFSNLLVKIDTNILTSENGIGVTTRLTDVYKSIKSLRSKTFDIDDEEEFLHVGIINYFAHKKNGGYVEIEISNKILPYFIELVQSEYTSYYLTVAMSLRNKYSQRFYEYCSQYRSSGIMYLDIDVLRKRFMLEEKYPNYAEIKRAVIEPAKKELKTAYDKGQCDICFDYTEEKQGRSVYRIKLSITSKEKEAENEKIKFKLEDYVYYIRTWLNSWLDAKNKPKNKIWIDELMRQLLLKPDNVEQLYDRLVKMQKEKDSSNYPALARFIITEDYFDV
jgi:plasmid replication initiation protein